MNRSGPSQDLGFTSPPKDVHFKRFPIIVLSTHCLQSVCLVTLLAVSSHDHSLKLSKRFCCLKCPKTQRNYSPSPCEPNCKLHYFLLCNGMHTLSFLSHRNLSFWAFLCMKTPSKFPVLADLSSMAFSPQPITWLDCR